MNFQIIFDGEALINNEIEPRVLSSALIAIDDLLRAANNIINHGQVDAKVKVKGSFQTGSFKINFMMSLLDQLKNIFTSNTVESFLSAKEIVSTVFGSLVVLIKFLKGASPDKVFEREDGSFIVYKDEKSLTIEKKAYELYKSYLIRKSFEQLVLPVKEYEGITSLAIKDVDRNQDFVVITKEEVSYFECPHPIEEKIDGEIRFETSINLISLSFKEGNKWYVNDGQSSFYARVEDEDFLAQIKNNVVSFSKGDILRVRIRREQFLNKTEQKLKVENFIEEVIKHEKAPKNLPLF